MLYWNSLSDFLSMGGYALYVWGSFGLTAVALGWELSSLVGRRRRALEQVRQWRLLNGEQRP
ncbi:MAG: heme exporter protein CcmD [Rubrivivax sp.]